MRKLEHSINHTIEQLIALPNLRMIIRSHHHQLLLMTKVSKRKPRLQSQARRVSEAMMYFQKLRMPMIAWENQV